MEPIQELNLLLNKAQRDASLYYVGIFYKDKELISKTSSRSVNLASYFGRLIERSLEMNEILPNFKQEFLFSEGKDYSIFVYYLPENFSIGLIHIGKPNFSLLKLTAFELSNNLKSYIPFLKQLSSERYSDEELKNEKIASAKTVTETKEISFQPEKNISELEAVLSDNFLQHENKKEDFSSPSIEDILNSAFSLDVEGKKEESFQENNVTEASVFEDIFEPNLVSQSDETATVTNVEDIMEKIKIEFIREIGPFGNFLFKKKAAELLSKKSITKFDVLKFITSLSEEISVPDKRNRFFENAKNHIV